MLCEQENNERDRKQIDNYIIQNNIGNKLHDEFLKKDDIQLIKNRNHTGVKRSNNKHHTLR